MSAGDITLAHAHDEYDELLSAVYYVDVPRNSGILIIRQNGEQAMIAPQAGLLVFFSPCLMHEVTKNNSRQMQLSIGMNFGVE